MGSSRYGRPTFDIHSWHVNTETSKHTKVDALSTLCSEHPLQRVSDIKEAPVTFLGKIEVVPQHTPWMTRPGSIARKPGS
jgi:hypothetical protein